MRFFSLFLTAIVLASLGSIGFAQDRPKIDPNAPWGKLRSKEATKCYTPPDYNQPFARFPVTLENKLPAKTVFCTTERFIRDQALNTSKEQGRLPITIYGVSFGTVGKAESHLAYFPKTFAGQNQPTEPINVARGEAFGWRMSTNAMPTPSVDTRYPPFVEVVVPPRDASGAVQSVFPYPIRWGTLFAKGTNGQWYANTQGYAGQSDADIAYRRTGEKSFQMAKAKNAVYAFWQTTIYPEDPEARYRRDIGGTIENFWQPTDQDPSGEYTIELWWSRKLVARQVFVLQ